MNSAQIEIQLIASLVAMACAIPGVFLVLRKMALISDAISHSILLGIVIGFFVVQDLQSPLLIILAALVGVLTVVLVELIEKTKLVKEDTAIGLVFPALFSIGVILIAKKANDIHLDVDAVLLGELAFAPFDRVFFRGMDMGPKSLWVMSCVLLFTLILLKLFYKELKVTTFDSGFAYALGFSPLFIHYGLMTVSSITIVSSFDAVGAILVVALMIAPAASAYLLTIDLKRMIVLSIVIGVFSAISGYWIAHFLDASIAGSMTTVLGIIFIVIYLFAPEKGWIAVQKLRKKQKIEVRLITFLLHINNHPEKEERHVSHLEGHINWHHVRAKTVLKLAVANNLIKIQDQVISLTCKGQEFVENVLHNILLNKEESIETIKEDFFLFRS